VSRLFTDGVLTISNAGLILFIVDDIVIYIYENLLNGKIYIGQTNNIKRRDRLHISGNISMPIDRAIKKYGRDNFSLNIISSSNDQIIANDDEIYWIARAKELLGIKNVYNVSNGGSAVMSGRKHSEETILKISESKKGTSPWNKGLKMSEDFCLKNSEAHKGLQSGKNGSMFGRKHSEETRKKISEAQVNNTWKLVDDKRIYSKKENNG
jgi:group I intron endonuclease